MTGNKRFTITTWALLLALAALPPLAGATRVTRNDFDAKSTDFSGNGWKLTKYVKKDPDSGLQCCFVRFEANGKVLHDFRCGPVKDSVSGQLDWTSIYHYKTEAKWPNLLAVMWYEGGAHSAYLLRVIKLADNFPIIFDSNGASFRYFEDLDHDGMPEIVAYSFAFDYFYESPVEFSHVDSTYGTLIATYSNHWKRYMWANHLFPDAFRDEENQSKQAFLKVWPSRNKIPVSIATDQYSKAADAYRALARWAVHTAYAEGEPKADTIFDQYCDPDLAVVTKHAFRLTLQNDQNYTTMLYNPVKR